MDDLIKRSAVLDLIADYDLSMGQVVRGIYALPSVSTEKTGRRIYKTMKGQFCSICDEQSICKFKYCPNCGAKMEV